MKPIRGRLKTARVGRGLTLRDVEALTGGAIKASSLSSYERGKVSPSCEKVELLARLYEVPMSYLCFCPYFARGGFPPVSPKRQLEGAEFTPEEVEVLRKILEKLGHTKGGKKD